jgi:thiol-disulfide isomerase/thioredoxin
MNKLFGLLLVFALFSCTNEDTVEENPEQKLENNFTITGTVVNGQNLNFYLEAMSQQGKISVAQGKSDGSGKFFIEGNIPGYGIYQLRMGESNEKIIPLTLVPNDNVKVNATFSSFNSSPQVSGTKWSDVMTRYMAIYYNFHIAQAELSQNPEGLSNDELTSRFLELKAPVDSFAIAEMSKDPGNPFNFVLYASATPTMGFNTWDPKNLDILHKVDESIAKSFPNSVVSNAISGQVYQIELAYNEYVATSSGTQPAPEIVLTKPNGEEIKLSDLRGKYVLVDFWASWCGPCRRENPNVVRLYHKYKNKGFTVFSVSLDNNADAWKAAIERDGLVWPNHGSDLLKWSSPVIQSYGFDGIPYTVLLNKEGNFIGTGLRGKELEQKLEEIFSK